MPLGYEVFAGNKADVTTVEHIVEMMERRYGKSDRICRFSGGEGIASALAAAGHPARVVAFDGDHQITVDGERALAVMLRGATAE